MNLRTKRRLVKATYRASLGLAIIAATLIPTLGGGIPRYATLLFWLAAGLALLDAVGTVLLEVGERLFARIPVSTKRRIFCERLHIHAGPIETVGPYSYIDCRRCEGLHTPMPRRYAAARFDTREQ